MHSVAHSRPSILVVDDDAKIVQLLRMYLEREGFDVRAARDGGEAIEMFRSGRPALIVLDRMLPEVDGVEVCRVVRAESDVPILMLSARGSVAERVYGINEGADDYLPKPFSPAELVVRVKAILRRASGRGARPSNEPVELEQADLTIDTQRYEVRRGSEVVPMTSVEFRLLAALVEARGRVLTREQLLNAVYGVDADAILDRTIDVHIGRMRDKLGEDPDLPRYIATVRGVGYRAAPPSAPKTRPSEGAAS